MEEQNRGTSELETTEEKKRESWELDFEASQQFARDAMERRYTYFRD